MQSRPRRLLAVAVTALVAIAVLVTALVRRARKVPWFPYVGAPISEAEYQALASKPQWRSRTLDVGNGVVLRGLERPSKNQEAPWVLFFGGNSAQFLQHGQLFLDRLIGDQDWGGALWAYRGFDGSGGQPEPAELENDAWQQYSHLMRDEHIAPSRIHLVAFSLGTGVLMALVARAHEAPPASITLLAPTTRLDMRTPAGSVSHRYETLKYLGQVKSPTLIVHGGRDQTLVPEGGQRIAEELGDRARFVLHPELGHLDLPESETAIADSRKFILSHRR